MRKELKQLINKIEQDFAINECDGFDEHCADCRATSLVKELKWLISLQD